MTSYKFLQGQELNISKVIDLAPLLFINVLKKVVSASRVKLSNDINQLNRIMYDTGYLSNQQLHEF